VGTSTRNAAVEIVTGLDHLFQLLRRLTPADGISLTAASTLRRLARDGEHRLSELAVAERVSQPAMTQLVSRLERDGLVRRAAHPGDGRVVIVAVTDAGRAVLDRRHDVRVARLEEALAALPAADRRAIVTALPAFDRLTALGSEFS
jgi:DNA-binding MarR family transcriptional regulator